MLIKELIAELSKYARKFQSQFQPCVIYSEGLELTEIVLKDTYIVWHPWGPYKGHAVDCGYDSDGDLVAIKIWDDVRRRPGSD